MTYFINYYDRLKFTFFKNELLRFLLLSFYGFGTRFVEFDMAMTIFRICHCKFIELTLLIKLIIFFFINRTTKIKAEMTFGVLNGINL